MNLSLKECIKDDFDDALKTYTDSIEYRQSREEANAMFTSFRTKLPEDLQAELNNIMNAFSNINSELAGEAYYRGVINGIAIRDDAR